MSSVLFFLVVWAALIMLSVHSAKKRGRDPVGWGIACALFFIVAYPCLLIAGETDEHRRALIREEEEIRRQVQLGEYTDTHRSV